MRVRPELCANLVKFVLSGCAARAAGGRYGCACLLGCVVLVALDAILFGCLGMLALLCPGLLCGLLLP